MLYKHEFAMINHTCPLHPIHLVAPFPFPVQFIAAAILCVPDGRYLFQLRDDKEGLPLRNHWALFGGEVEPGEDGQAAVLREIREELTYDASDCCWYHETLYVLPRREKRIVRKAFYLIPVEPGDVASMTLREGSDMRMMSVDMLMQLPNIAPWDLAVVMMHARQQTIFPDE